MTSISSEVVRELPYRIRAVFDGVATTDNRAVSIDPRLRCQGIRFNNETPGVFYVTCDSRPRFTVPPGVTSFNFAGGVGTLYIDPQALNVGGADAIGALTMEFFADELTEDPPEQEQAYPFTQQRFDQDDVTFSNMGAGPSVATLLSPPATSPPGLFRVRVMRLTLMVSAYGEAGAGAGTWRFIGYIAPADLSFKLAQLSVGDRATAAGQRINPGVVSLAYDFYPIGVPIPPLNALEVSADGNLVGGVAPAVFRCDVRATALGVIERTPEDEVP